MPLDILTRNLFDNERPRVFVKRVAKRRFAVFVRDGNLDRQVANNLSFQECKAVCIRARK